MYEEESIFVGRTLENGCLDGSEEEKKICEKKQHGGRSYDRINIKAKYVKCAKKDRSPTVRYYRCKVKCLRKVAHLGIRNPGPCLTKRFCRAVMIETVFAVD